MFLRVVRAAGAKGVKNEYVRVVEAYRENGKTRHRTVLNLGRRDLLAAHLDLDKLRRLLQGDAGFRRLLRADERTDFTLDIDATQIVAEKREARYSY